MRSIFTRHLACSHNIVQTIKNIKKCAVASMLRSVAYLNLLLFLPYSINHENSKFLFPIKLVYRDFATRQTTICQIHTLDFRMQDTSASCTLYIIHHKGIIYHKKLFLLLLLLRILDYLMDISIIKLIQPRILTYLVIKRNNNRTTLNKSHTTLSISYES